MQMTKQANVPPVPDWRDLVVDRDSAGYGVSERPAGRCCVERRLASRRVGLAFVLASGLSWLIGSAEAVTGILAHGAVAALLSGIGLLCLFASWRCVTRKVCVDFEARHLRVAMKESNGRERVLHVVPFDAISSLYLRRADHGSQAMLILRPLGGADEIAMIGGPAAELEALHRKLSRDIAHAIDTLRNDVVRMPEPAAKPAITPRRVTPVSVRRDARRHAAGACG